MQVLNNLFYYNCDYRRILILNTYNIILYYIIINCLNFTQKNYINILYFKKIEKIEIINDRLYIIIMYLYIIYILYTFQLPIHSNVSSLKIVQN